MGLYSSTCWTANLFDRGTDVQNATEAYVVQRTVNGIQYAVGTSTTFIQLNEPIFRLYNGAQGTSQTVNGNTYIGDPTL